jgi:hypothetical protein
VTDYIVNDAAFDCEGAAALFGGTAGAPVTVFASLPGGHFKTVFSGYVYDAEVVAGPPPQAWVTLGGEACGQRGRVVHGTMLTCKRALVWNASKSALGLAPLSQAKITR